METSDNHDSLAKERAASLRSELKLWEKTFAAANEGRKASREEIKNNLDIAAKYKEYNQLKDILQGKPVPSKEAASHAPSRKRKTHDDDKENLQGPTTPSSKRRRVKPKFSTPQRGEKKAPRSGQIEVLEDGASVNETGTPIFKKLYVGPTPQKDGRALGLFDLLSPAKSETYSPRKQVMGYRNAAATTAFSSPQGKGRAALEPTAANNGGGVPSTPRRPHAASSKRVLGVTPQKRKLEEEGDNNSEEEEDGYVRRHSRTPQSVGRHFLLSTFVPTPSAHAQKTAALEKDLLATPSASRNTDLAGPATPAFLRRDRQLQESSLTSPSSSRWFVQPRRPSFFGLGGKNSRSRPLSSMIADLRKTEDERLDEQLDLLREIESGDGAGGAAAAPATTITTKSNPVVDPTPPLQQQVVGQESQPHVLDSIQEEDEDQSEHEGRLGPDGTQEELAERNAMMDAAAAPNVLPDGRVWKKKGLRRQTRRVLLRPQAPGKAAPIDIQSNPLLYGGAEDNRADNDDEETHVALETQLEPAQAGNKYDAEVGSDSGDHHDEHDGDDNYVDNDDSGGGDYAARGKDDEIRGNSGPRKRRKLTKAPPPAAKQKARAGAAANKDEEREGGEEEGMVKRAARKISATAHANFCRLKIKSKNKKNSAGGRGRGGFGRGRR